MGNRPSHFLLIIIFSAALAFCSVFSFAQTEEKAIIAKAYYPPVKIQLVNFTGYRLDSILVYNTFFTVIEKDSSTPFFEIPAYEDGYGIQGKIKELEIRRGLAPGWDGKPVSYNYSGATIIVEIILKESRIQKGVFRLYTRFKQRVNNP
ncbi:MAG: hypothetical protein J0G96_06615 [Flavobacteriia bacterium]|nr:hypothetical protein [Flavobacteriia bacterium]OJX38501.1 MAG: hypothetical protein BGO87_10305 [Flavobacteriia bacterium 40-80]